MERASIWMLSAVTSTRYVHTWLVLLRSSMASMIMIPLLNHMVPIIHSPLLPLFHPFIVRIHDHPFDDGKGRYDTAGLLMNYVLLCSVTQR